MYYYAIRAVSDAGAGEWTQRDFPGEMLTAKVPDKPVATTSVDGQNITLSWTAPANNGATITMYDIQSTDMGPVNEDGDARVESDRVWGSDVNPTPLAATTWTQSAVTPGEMRYYRVRAMNSTGDGEWSDEVSARADPNPPGAPDALAGTDSATARDREVLLSWTLPTDAGTGGAEITSVEIRRWNSSTGRWDIIKDDLAKDANEYTDTGLDPGTTYSYQVRAVNEAGPGVWSNVGTGTTTTVAPAAPVLTATADEQDIELSWTVPDDNGAAITRYEIQRFPSVDTNGDPLSNWGDDDTATSGDNDYMLPQPLGATTYTDRDLEPGKTYNYRIRAVNSVGAGQHSVTAKATTPAMAPGKIDLMLVEDLENAVKLTWDAPEANGSAITAYQIIRWDPDQPGWKNIVNDLPASRQEYTESGLEAGTRYFYRIRAVNAAGEGAWSTFNYAVTKADEE